jgi:hypothetical protein
MMPGRYGLILVIFGILVWVARWLDLDGLRQISQVWFQVIDLLLLLGLGACIVGVLGRYWAAVRRPD